MLKRRSIRTVTTLKIVTATLATFAFASQANATTNILNALKVAPHAGGATPGQALPAISNPKPYRQGVMATCNSNSAQFGSNLCIMKFDKVLSGHLLQIDNINCVVNNGTAILFNSAINLNAARVYGFAQPTISGSSGGKGRGPYYFKALETPILLGAGSSSTDVGICQIFGTLWQTN